MHAAFATLALTTAKALDEVVASGEKRYVVAQLARSHLLALETLQHLEVPAEPHAFAHFLEKISRPSGGRFDESAVDDRM